MAQSRCGVKKCGVRPGYQQFWQAVYTQIAQLRAVNPVTNDAWYKLLADKLTLGDSGKPIAQECCWGVDESGFQSGLGSTQERAIGTKGRKPNISSRTGVKRILRYWSQLVQMTPYYHIQRPNKVESKESYQCFVCTLGISQ